MDIKLILIVGYTVVTLLNCLVLLINSFKRNKIAKAEAEGKVADTSVEDAGLEIANYLLKEAIPNAMILAEKEKNVSGTTKKMIATSQVIQDLAVKGVDYKEYAGLVDEAIERNISLTKSVNTNQKYSN